MAIIILMTTLTILDDGKDNGDDGNIVLSLQLFRASIRFDRGVVSINSLLFNKYC